MTERLPLSATTTDPVERALLRSVQDDLPGPQAMSRTAAALGLSAAVLAAPSTSAGALVSSSGVLASSSLTSGVGASLPWLAVKAVVMGALCGSVLLVGVNAVTPAKTPLEHRVMAGSGSTSGPTGDVGVTSLALPLASAEPVSEPGAASRSDVGVSTRSVRKARAEVLQSSSTLAVNSEVPVAEPAQVVRPQAPRQAIVATTSSLPAPALGSRASDGSIREEIATIDLVRQMLRENNASSALTELDRYRSRWPSGVFSMEATVLRVEALLGLGDRAAAEHAATSVIDAQPNSRHAARLRALLASAKSSDQNPSFPTGKGL